MKKNIQKYMENNGKNVQNTLQNIYDIIIELVNKNKLKNRKAIMKKLIIVESPAKATTIKKFLGTNVKVIASKGHLRDLPKSRLGIDIENNFEPEYINVRGKGDLIKELKKESTKVDEIYLATDPDREGEAIAWHLSKLLRN